MDPLVTSAAGGMRARLETLDLLANNIANASTSGFKADRESFLPWVGEEAAGGAEATEAPFLKRHWTDFSQGPLSKTGSALDVGLDGRGFFEVVDGDRRLWTRNGSFHLNLKGKLESSDGYLLRVIPATGNDYHINPALPVDIDPSGTISQEGVSLGRIDLAEFSDSGVLEKHGRSYFKVEDATLTPARSQAARFSQGYLETANAAAVESSVRLVSVMRQFESLQRATTIGAEMNRRSIEEVAKIPA